MGKWVMGIWALFLDVKNFSSISRFYDDLIEFFYQKYGEIEFQKIFLNLYSYSDW